MVGRGRCLTRENGCPTIRSLRQSVDEVAGGSSEVMWGQGEAGGQEDTPEDLPGLLAPKGYRRDRQGRWRYEATGERVPGARDVTLTSLHGGVPRGAEYKAVAVEAVRTSPELAWCLSIAERDVVVQTMALGRRGGRVSRVVLVPRVEWERRSRVPLGLVAPELMPERLLDTERVARLAGVGRQTIATYLARGVMPLPVARVANSPLWSLPVVERWLAERPGQGVGGGPRRAAAGRRESVGKTRGPEGRRAPGRKGKDLLDWADAVLERFGVEES